MVFPFTVTGMMRAVQDVLYGEANPLVSMLRSASYLFLLALQLLALYLTGSRGPWLGWLVGSFLLALWMSLYWRRRSLTVAILLAALLGGLLLLSLVLAGGSKENLLSRSPLGRLQNLANAEDSSARVRIAIWQSVSRLVLSPKPLVFPDESQDQYHALRSWIGYGPESMGVVFHQVYPPELAQLESRYTTPDRSHNETWDALVTTGLVGLATYLTLFACIFYSGMKWLGMVKGWGQRSLFWALCLAGGLVGAGAFGVLFGVAYLGLGLPLGLLAGVGFFLLVRFLSDRISPAPGGVEGWAGMIIIAILAAISGHLVEIHLGFAT
jgi:O-antigen ligase